KLAFIVFDGTAWKLNGYCQKCIEFKLDKPKLAQVAPAKGRSSRFNFTRCIGGLVLAFGIFGISRAMQMQTSIKLDAAHGGEMVHNLSLAHQQMMYVLVFGIMVIAGLLISLFGDRR